MSVLCYHSVDPTWDDRLALDPADFARQCEWLARRRRVIPLADAAAAFDRRGRLPSGATAITFDDGYRALYDHAFPVLRRLGLPVTVFLVAKTLPAGSAVDWVTERPLPRPIPTLTLDQVLELQEAGVAFGSHSWAHHDLTTLGEEQCERDLRESRELLEDVLRRPVPHLAYPKGRHDERVRRAARRAGYSHAFTLPEAAEARGPHAIPRAGVYPGNGLGALRLKTTRAYVAARTSPVFPYARRVLRR